MNNRICLIDGDALTYQSSKETLAESIQNIDEKINNIFEKTEATHYVIFVSNSPYFRHKIDPLYKSQRSKYTSNLKWLKTLKKYLIEGWGAQSMNLVEADDLVSYWMNKDICISDTTFETRETLESALDLCKSERYPTFTFESVEKVMCSPDKDLLQSVVGKNFNYTYKLEDKTKPESLIKGWWVETSVEDASFFIWEQMIMNDNSDGIKGIYGKGKAWCDKNFTGKSLKEVQHLVYETYISEYGIEQGIYNFQKNYRLLHLLSSDEDFMREVDKLPEFPVITEIIRDSQTENLDEKLTF